MEKAALTVGGSAFFFNLMANHVEHKEKELLNLIKHGDQNAMRLLYDSYSGYLAAVCARYIESEDDRKDVLQECFIKIFKSVGRFEFRGEGSLKAWMIRITANESLRFLRTSSTYSFVDYGGNLPDVPEEPDVDSIPDDVIDGIILSMPAGYRAVFNLYVFEQKSHKEIAGMLGIGEGTSASQFSRAKAYLAKRINDYKAAHKND